MTDKAELTDGDMFMIQQHINNVTSMAWQLFKEKLAKCDSIDMMGPDEDGQKVFLTGQGSIFTCCLLYTSPSPRD